MRKVLIIIGASKSGSTVLAKSIGGHSQSFTLGEANRFNDELINPDGVCSCGLSLDNCEFWREIRKELTGSDDKDDFKEFPMGMFKQFTGKTQLHKLFPTVVWGKKYRNDLIDKEIDNTIKFYNSVFDRTGKKLLIDSTKGLFRAFVLNSNRKEGVDFYFVHILRDGRGVLNSSLKKTYKIEQQDGTLKEFHKDKLDRPIPVKSPSEAIHYWLYVNMRNFILLKLFASKRTVFVKYEEFTKNPEKILKSIVEKTGLEYEPSMLDFETKEHHILGGNSSRINAKKIRNQDDAWRRSLDKKVLNEFNLKAGWFNRLVGYK